MQETGNRNAYGQHRARRHPENIDRSGHTVRNTSAEVHNAARGNAAGQNVPRQNTASRSAPRQSTVSQTGSRPRTQAVSGAYRFTADSVRSTGSVRQGRPVTSNRTPDGRRPALDPKAAAQRRKEAEKEARKTQKKAARTTAVAAYKERHIARVSKKEEAWQKDIVRVRGGVDKVMLGLILTLVCLGTIAVFSASYPYALNEGLDMYYYSKRQIGFVAGGLFIMFIASRVPYTWYKTGIGKLKIPIVFVFYAAALVLLVLVLLIGSAEGVAQRWLYIGPISVQPSEFMKVALVMMVAWYIDRYKKNIEKRLDWKYNLIHTALLPAIPIGFACFLIILEKHLSGTIITGILGVAVMLMGGCHFGWTMGLAGCAGAVALAAFLKINPYAWERITTFTNENADKLDELYQTTQGLYAIGSGGLFGVGLGHSRQKYSFVSAAHTDFIFSIWCEELGFLGAVFLILLFIAFVLRGYTIASRAPDTFSSLVAYGISTHVGLQALMNMCVVADIIPNTGVSLPFFSYGGSSLIVLLGEMGILLSISRQYYMKRKDFEEKQRIDALEID
ncbi:MAG: cell division protein FtsW [Clostridia bacterium]|nr:cell division protein FtsW [Clostridia bacterium]